MRSGPFPPWQSARQTTTARNRTTAAITLVVVWTGTVAADATQGSLQTAYQSAHQLAATSGGLAQAMEGYQAVIETHLANESILDATLRELARCYMDSGQVAEGIQYFLTLGRRMYGSRRADTLKEIVNQFALKYPEQTKEAIARLQSSSGREARVAPVMPSQELSKAILQREDRLLREKALERLRNMLATASSDEEKKEGLATLGAALAAQFDRRPFRDLVVPLLVSPTPEVRAMALRCLPGLEATTTDLDLVLPMARDASAGVRKEVGPALIRIGQGQQPEKVIPALMLLLQDKDQAIIEWTIRNMWGQYASPEFDALLIQLSRNQQFHHNVIYFSLSPMKTKSVAVCRRLIEELADPDWNNSGRAAWGLTYGVPDEAKSMVEDGLLEALPQETNDNTRREEFRALRLVATEKSRAYLQSVVDSQQETDRYKQLAREILAGLDRNP